MTLVFDQEMLVKLLLASVLGAVIGLEREVHGRSAGFRTHLLVSLGSCLYVILSIDFYRTFGNSSGAGPVGVDPARIAAQVVSGIGFLGAGAIIREKSSIRGLTTAACLWVAAAIGLSCGAGRFAPAVVVTFLAFLSLLLLKKVEFLLQRDTYSMVKVWSLDIDGQTALFEQAMMARQVEVVSLSIEKNVVHQTVALQFQVKHHARRLASILAEEIARIEGVSKVWIE